MSSTFAENRRLFVEQQLDILNTISGNLLPKPKISGSQWVNENFYLSPESSSQPGKMTLLPYQTEIVDVMCDEWTELVVFEKSSRIGYNKMLNCSIAYIIVNDPCVILFYSPNDQLAKDIAVTEIEPMVRDNPQVAERIRPNIATTGTRRKLVDNTMLKTYTGGYMQMLGAATPNNFAQRTARFAIVDELSRWLDDIGGEGDGVALASVRVSDFYNGKVIVGSSPTLTFRNKIGQSYLTTDMRVRKNPCHHCGVKQEWDWDNMKWDVDENGELIPTTVGFECQNPDCGKLIKQKHQMSMDIGGEWEKQRPDVKRRAGFRIWTAYGYSPKMTWVGIVTKYLQVKDNPLTLQAFTNTVLGRSWDALESTTTPGALIAKKEEYSKDWEYDLPEEALIITAGVDTQNDRLEMLVVAHGLNHERWIIDYQVILGDPAQDETWVDLDRYYDTLRYTHPLSSEPVGIYAMAIDSGGGRTQYVYDYCKPRLHKRIYPIKGASTINAKIVDKRESYTKKNSKYKITHFQLNTIKIKDFLMVGIISETKGQNYIHFPDKDFVNDEFVDMLLAEYKDNETGKWLLKVAGSRNEIFDVLVYSEAALLITGVDMERLARDREEVMRKIQEAKTAEMQRDSDDKVARARGTIQLSSGGYD